jgi:cyanophycinase
MLAAASGVWIVGGSPSTLADTYWHTATERALRAVLDRGGVVGGSSAGAVIQASRIPTRHPDRGFGWLRHTFVMAHLNRKNAQDLLVRIVAENPEIIGIGIPEHTAVVITGDQLEVVGSGDVVVADGRVHDAQPLTLVHPGARLILLPRQPAGQ